MKVEFELIAGTEGFKAECVFRILELCSELKKNVPKEVFYLSENQSIIN